MAFRITPIRSVEQWKSLQEAASNFTAEVTSSPTPADLARRMAARNERDKQRLAAGQRVGMRYRDGNRSMRKTTINPW